MANSTPTDQLTETQEPKTISQPPAPPPTAPTSPADLHTLLLLADSALPLGSFAFSSGLESFLAHQPRPATHSRFSRHSASAAAASAQRFLPLSLLSVASTSLPYLLAAHRAPARAAALDDELDAGTLCAVARRASVAQGRALLALWERCFAAHYGAGDGREERAGAADARAVLRELCLASRDGDGLAGPGEEDACAGGHGHFAVVWGTVTRAMNLDLRTAAYAFLLAHTRGVLGAAVRAGAMGPYQAQAELADPRLRARIDGLVQHLWDVEPRDAAQTVPALDLWVGRHEKLYSRIFNS
jgi:urease accessory protein